MAVSSWCRAVGWRLSCYGRQVFSTRVGSHMDALLTNSSQIFFVWKVCSYKFISLALEPVLARALAPACVARHYGICTFANSNLVLVQLSRGVLDSPCAKISTFAQTRESNLVLVRRKARRTFAHTN